MCLQSTKIYENSDISKKSKKICSFKSRGNITFVISAALLVCVYFSNVFRLHSCRLVELCQIPHIIVRQHVRH